MAFRSRSISFAFGLALRSVLVGLLVTTAIWLAVDRQLYATALVLWGIAALATAERAFCPAYHVTAEYLNDLGFTELDNGNYQTGRKLLQQALAIYETRYGQSHEYVATTLGGLARADDPHGRHRHGRQRPDAGVPRPERRRRWHR